MTAQSLAEGDTWLDVLQSAAAPAQGQSASIAKQRDLLQSSLQEVGALVEAGELLAEQARSSALRLQHMVDTCAALHRRRGKRAVNAAGGDTC